MKILIDISSKLDEQRIAQEEVDEVRSRRHRGGIPNELLSIPAVGAAAGDGASAEADAPGARCGAWRGGLQRQRQAE